MRRCQTWWRKYPQRYRNMTLKELSDEMHVAMRELNLTSLLHLACDVDPDPVLTPAQTYQKLLREWDGEGAHVGDGRADRRGDAGAVPSGDPGVDAGRAAGGQDSPVIKLILALEEFGKRFPGFEREVHGVEVDAEGNYWMRSVIEASPKGNGKASPARNAKRRGKKVGGD